MIIDNKTLPIEDNDEKIQVSGVRYAPKKNKKPVESQEEEPIESVKDEEPFESSLEEQLDQLKHIGSLEGDKKKIYIEVNKLTGNSFD